MSEMTSLAFGRSPMRRFAKQARVADYRSYLQAMVRPDGPIPGAQTAGDRIIATLEATRLALQGLDPTAHDDSLFSPAAGLTTSELRVRLNEVTKSTTPASFWGRLSPSRWL